MADWNWVTPRIALGSEPSASDIPAMHRQGITDVLDLRGEPRAGETSMAGTYWLTGINYHYDPMQDRGGLQPISVYQEGVRVIQDALANPAAKILVHCSAGQYRSPSMVYAYLRSVGFSPTMAWNMIRAARPIVQDQYVASAERAVPYLSAGPSSGKGLAATIVVLSGLGLMAWYAREARAR